MKKILFALCIACAASPAIAQNNEAPDGSGAHSRMKMSAEERAKFMTDKMQQALSLSADQYAKVFAVNTEVGKRRQALMTGDSRPDRSAFAPIDEYRQAQFATILTAAQMEQWKILRSEQADARRHGDRMDQRATDMPARTATDTK